MRSPEQPPTDGEGRLVAQLEAASNLALFGAVKLGRDFCAAIFLNHLPLLGFDRQAKRRFVECLLLLGMTNLLTRLLRALDGVELEVTKLVADGSERMILSFSNGRSLNIPLSELGSRTKARGQFAAAWSEKLLEEAERPSDGTPPPPAETTTPARATKAKQSPKYERV